MVELGDEEIIPWILHKLARHGWWGGKHTNIENIPKGAPPHMRRKIMETTNYLVN
jgi:hypothetical protein